ncbi:MAG: AAA family ATPase [Oligoflexia bacterium]|nr:AAA family ATPase [Oligoflexia bacterium]
MKLSPLWDKSIIICCGTGGVGKTTTSAALSIRAALQGKRVALITIDPAKRLATSLGLKTLNAEPQDITDKLTEHLKTEISGQLSALMLDSENTFYNFLLTVGGKEIHDQFRKSELFEIIAGNFGGAHEFLAMEKLYELHQSNHYDIILLDTPPAKHTLDFLDAPDLIAKFFDDRIFSWFLTNPRENSFKEKIRAKGAQAALKILEKLTGNGVINDFISLAPHIYQVKNAFVSRQSEIQKLIQSKKSGCVFITSPADLSKGELEPFLVDTKEKNISILAYIVNRSLKHIAPIEKPPGFRYATPIMKENYKNIRFLVEEEEKNFKLLQELANTKQLTLSVPELETDIHDLPSLMELSEHFR